MTEQYDINSVNRFDPSLFGPHGLATVKVNRNGTTQEGWGLTGKKQPDGTRAPGFMTRYPKLEFNPRLTSWSYERRGLPFAFVMRSLAVVCIDIDGKNGGFGSAAQLGRLPITLAETSKSGNGYHLFYSTGESWDDDTGFNRFDDQIGLVQGIDIRATGCVYHHDTQRWNDREIVPVPDFLADMLTRKKQRRLAAADVATKVKELDEVDMLVAHHELHEELAKPIAPGKRNNTLFAIGSRMKESGVEDWETAIKARAQEVGIDLQEAEKIVANIANYGA